MPVGGVKMLALAIALDVMHDDELLINYNCEYNYVTFYDSA